MPLDTRIVAQVIGRATGRPFELRERRRLSGGDINWATLLGDGERRYFVKFNRTELAPMLAAEADALQELAHCPALHIPSPICRGETNHHAFLVLEHLKLQRLSAASQRRLGRAMAALHAIDAERFGWHRDNTIGTTPQANGWRDDWAVFWRERRLAPQLRLAAERGGGRSLIDTGERVMARVEELLAGHSPRSSLVHGDLWAGNAAADSAGRPVIFDPATYYGDRETDLAMMSLFGGFEGALAAYCEQWPPAAGYAEIRRPLYQSYHLLNHFNLFGGHYAEAARDTLQRLLAAA